MRGKYAITHYKYKTAGIFNLKNSFLKYNFLSSQNNPVTPQETMTKRTLGTLLFGILLLLSCENAPTGSNAHFVTTDGTKFTINGKPYNYIGTNMWYSTIIASEGCGGDKERFLAELDNLKALGVTNLRILTGPDAGSSLANPAKPYLQCSPGVLNDTLLKGLDYTLAELEKRNMHAVIYLNNAWDWSGGYGFYLKECGYGDSPNANVEGGYERYVDYSASFSRCKEAQELYFNYIKQIVTRKNSITGRLYKDEPAIMSWQLCNEPRPFARDNKEQFAEWIAKAAAIIKAADPNHLVSTGSEGYIGCEADRELCERIHSDKNIDYLTIHIWPVNWGWAPRSNPDSGIHNACSKSKAYIEEHTAMAEKLGKPMVIEEFGYPREGNRAGHFIPTKSRDTFYRFVFNEVASSVKKGGPIAGCNFWGWGGNGKVRDAVWQQGDDYLCDPPHEPQGWYSVFADDSSTIAIIEEFTKIIK